MIVIRLPEDDEARVYINPEIMHREGEREIEEGCLSIPGYKAFITRSMWVKFRALDHSAKLVKLRAEDLLAQALEHEVDHLNGIMYIDHLKAHQQLIPVDSEADEPEDTGASGPNGTQPSVEAPQGSAEAVADSNDTPASLKIR